MLHSCAHLTAAERSPALPCRSLAACIHCLHAYVHGPQPLPCFACPSSPFYRLPPRQCIPTTTLRSLPYAAWQGGADLSLLASWAHPLLWRRGSLVAAPSGVPGWHNSHPLHPSSPVFLSFHLPFPPLLSCLPPLPRTHWAHLHTCTQDQQSCHAPPAHTALPALAPLPALPLPPQASTCWCATPTSLSCACTPSQPRAWTTLNTRERAARRRQTARPTRSKFRTPGSHSATLQPHTRMPRSCHQQQQLALARSSVPCHLL